MRVLRICSLVLLVPATLVIPSCLAQQDSINGIVSGLVMCGDTGRPARFAEVILLNVPGAHLDMSKSDSPHTDASLSPRAANASAASSNFVETQTDSDGRFTIPGVARGDYYAYRDMLCL